MTHEGNNLVTIDWKSVKQVYLQAHLSSLEKGVHQLENARYACVWYVASGNYRLQISK